MAGIVIVDYDVGNLGSIRNMFKRIGVQADISSRHDDILAADKLVLPGVGAFDYGMAKLRERNLVNVLNQKVLKDNCPVLGICLGAQLFLKGSEEGSQEGLGWIPGRTVRFSSSASTPSLKVPHMGWNEIAVLKPSRIFEELGVPSRFYFVHSFHFELQKEEDAIANTLYGHPFVSAFERGNIVGVQFHPEKSHKFGMKILKNFADRY